MSVQVTDITTTVTVTITNQSVSPETSIVGTVTATTNSSVTVVEGSRFGPGAIQRPGINSAPNFLNGWSNFDGVNENFGYTVRADGMVLLFGLIKPGISTPFFTLPDGYRPLFKHRFIITTNTGPMEIQISNSGVITCATITSLTYLSLDGIQFLQEQ